MMSTRQGSFSQSYAWRLSCLLMAGWLLACGSLVFAQGGDAETLEKSSWTERTRARAAFVADAGLAALRTAPAPGSNLKQRLRVGRRVYVLGKRRVVEGRVYEFVAVTRRTRGWIDRRALVRPAQPGDDARLLALIRAETGGYERLRLCRLFETLLHRSPQLPTVLLLLGETAEAEASLIQRRAERRVSQRAASGNADTATYFDEEPALDRYNRIGVKFRYDAHQRRYRYDGAAYRRLVNQYPKVPEAELARQRLASF
ncbi:MAG: hypothetical protein ACUVR8_00135 [Acidobacteriota bacterium]